MSIQDLDQHDPELPVPQADVVPEESASAEVDTSSSAHTNVPPVKKLCGVCHEKEPRYKCPRCLLPYCSAACSTLHKPTHPAVSPPAPRAPSPSAPPPTRAPRPGTLSASGFRGPFADLDDSTELRELFKRYPRLRSQLEEIHAATQAPIGKKGWTADRGLENGAVALGRAREVCGPDGEGVREFSRLVLRVVGGEGRGDVILREVVEEDVRIVEGLLRGEM